MDENLSFIEALETNNLSLLKKVIKTDKHNHLILGAHFEDLIQISGNSDIKKREKPLKGLSEFFEYLQYNIRPHIYRHDIFEIITEKAVQAALDDGVVLLEGSIDLKYSDFYPDGLTGLLGFIKKLKETYGPRGFKPELGITRPIQKEMIDTLVHPAMDSGLFASMDIYGEETTDYNTYLKPILEYGKSKNLKTKIHIGEFSIPWTVLKTIEDLPIDEIQHGITAANDHRVMDLIKEKDIILNVCPSSNVELMAVSSMAVHPIRKLYDAGVKVTINTDDLMIFHSTVSQEFMKLHREKIFSPPELNEIRKTALPIAE